MGLEDFEKCNTCLKETCSYKPDDLECIEEYDPCMFCLIHTNAKKVSKLSRLIKFCDKEYTFEFNARYCPCCGRLL